MQDNLLKWYTHWYIICMYIGNTSLGGNSFVNIFIYKTGCLIFHMFSVLQWAICNVQKEDVIYVIISKSECL